MKLSDAIRLGAMLRPQAFGHAFYKGGSCALGAAQEAMGYPPGTEPWVGFEDSPWNSFFQVTIEKKTECPAGCGIYAHFPPNVFLIPHLNDDHHWTRERIADWVETIEPAETVASEPVAVLATVQP